MLIARYGVRIIFKDVKWSYFVKVASKIIEMIKTERDLKFRIARPIRIVNS